MAVTVTVPGERVLTTPDCRPPLPTEAWDASLLVQVACRVTFWEVRLERMAVAVSWKTSPTGSVRRSGLTRGPQRPTSRGRVRTAHTAPAGRWRLAAIKAAANMENSLSASLS